MLYASVVLPAPNGCNLTCKGCAIAQRNEARESVLSPEDYVWFLSETLINLKVARFAIQGYEPLLPEVWPLTRRLLRIAAAALCKSSIITNGIYLSEYARDLAPLVDSLTVSLDSYDPKIHDYIRGKQGAFEQTVKGIEFAQPYFNNKIMIASVLHPGKRAYLQGMPELLQSLKIKEWSVGPLINFRSEKAFVDIAYVKESIIWLADNARQHGVEVFLSDELRSLEDHKDIYETFFVRTLGKNACIFRLSPDGSCSIGKEVLRTSESIPKWDRVTAPFDFLLDRFASVGKRNDLRVHPRIVRSFLAGLVGFVEPFQKQPEPQPELLQANSNRTVIGTHH
jgi:MoaA/NifB/PqqE/SkfB family radical SAM enzyme